MQINFDIVISTVLLFLCHCQYTNLECIYRKPKIEQIVTGIEMDPLPPRYRVRKSASNNLRIHFDYTSSFTTYYKSEVIVNKILEPAKHELEAILQVKNPNTGILRVDRSCISGKYTLHEHGIKGCSFGCDEDTTCLGVSIPNTYLKRCKSITNSGEILYSGIEGPGKASVDIVIIVTFTYCNDMAHASAASCFSENELDRPILGVIELCRGSIQADYNILESIKIVQHEIIHVLGFAVDKYAFFRYSNGKPIVPRDTFGLPVLGVHPIEKYYLWNDKIIKQVRRQRESIHGSYIKTMNAFVLENVVKVAREHFSCPSIDAVDLEDAGVLGSALTHFDEYFLHNEMMTPLTNNGIDVISKFTLALLKDTGWYYVDYSKAEDLEYGKGKGCILPLEGCYRYMENQRKRNYILDPFCDRVFQYGAIAQCSPKRNYFYYCHLTKYNEVLKQNQYFRKIPGVKDEDTQYFTGHTEYNEFCPIKVVFKKPNSICNDITNTGLVDKYNILPSYFGSDSLCFENTLENDVGNIYYGASCQRFKYNARLATLQVFIGSESFTCPSVKTFDITIENYFKISLKCPENLKEVFSKASNLILRMSTCPYILILGINFLF